MPLEPLVVAPLAVAATFAASGWVKRDSADDILSAMMKMSVPKPLVHRRIAQLVPWVELALAVGLVLLPTPAFWLPAIGSALLAAIYFVLVAVPLAQGRQLTCGCFGRIGEGNLSWRTMVRNSLLLVAGLGTVALAARGCSVIDILVGADAETWAWLAGLVGSTALVWSIMARAPRGRVRPARPSKAPSAPREVAPAKPAAPGPADPPAEDDYVRTPFPDAPVRFDDGTESSLYPWTQSQARLLVFLSASCSSCQRTASWLPTWQIALPAIGIHAVYAPEDLELIRRHAQFAVPDDVIENCVIDTDRALADAFSVTAKPAAVLLGTDGLLAGGPVMAERGIIEFVMDVFGELML